MKHADSDADFDERHFGIISGFLKQPDAPIKDRLLMALEGRRDAGGQMSKGVPRPERSTWIRVVDRLDFPEIDVCVDLHDKTLAELNARAV